MKLFRKFFMRLSGLFRKKHRDADLSAEIESNLQMHTDENIRRGMTPHEARRHALIQLGGVEQTKEIYRDQRGLPFLETLAQDLRYAARQMRKNPGFAFTSILILSLGICASSSIFAFVDAALIKPLPYRDSNRLLNVTESVAMIPRANLSYLDYLDWKKMNTVLSSLDIYTGEGYMLRTSSGVDMAPAARVSDGFFGTLGVTPLLGRDFHAGEDLASAPLTVILTYGAWQKRFGGNPGVIGQSVSLSDKDYTIIGVLPQSFQFAPRANAEFFTTERSSGECESRRSCHNLVGVGRLKDGVTLDAAVAQFTQIAQRLEQEYPDSNRGQGASIMPLSEAIFGDIRPILLVLLVAAGLLLLIACVNVASLLLARSESRRREIAVRTALGASRGRLVRQFAAEGMALVFAATAVGLLLASQATRALLWLIPADMLKGMPFLQGLGMNWHVIAFAAVVAFFATLVFSLTPIVRLSFSEMHDGLAEGGRGAAGMMWQRLGANLVVVELAIAIVLLGGAGLLGKSLYALLHVNLGFRPENLATLVVNAPDTRYGKDPETIALGRKVVSSISALPGVQSVGLTSVLPVSFNGNTDWIRFVGRPYNGEHNEVNMREVSSDYFQTIGAKLVRGRYFTDAEDESKPLVAVINESLAKKYFPNEDPIGKKYGDIQLSPNSIREIIGIVEDVREGPLDSQIWPAEYFPFNQDPTTSFVMAVKTSSSPQPMLPEMVGALREIDLDIGTSDPITMDERIHSSVSAYIHRSSTWLVAGFASLALLLGVVGLYGVVAYSVGQRTREIGVRVALGAQQRDVLGMVLGQGMRLAAAGVTLGIVLALLLTRLMAGILFGVKPGDPWIFAAAAVFFGVVALAACWIPARRAMQVDPVVALRYE